MMTVAPPVVQPSLGLMAFIHGVAAYTRQKKRTFIPPLSQISFSPPPFLCQWQTMQSTVGREYMIPLGSIQRGSHFISMLMYVKQIIKCFIKRRPRSRILVSKKKKGLIQQIMCQGKYGYYKWLSITCMWHVDLSALLYRSKQSQSKVVEGDGRANALNFDSS